MSEEFCFEHDDPVTEATAYVVHLLRSGMAEDQVWEDLTAKGLLEKTALQLMQIARRQIAQEAAGPAITELRSGEDDFGRVFDNAADRDRQFGELRRRLRERRERARRAAQGLDDPDPTFAVAESFAQVQARDLNRPGRPWITAMVILAVCSPLLALLVFLVISGIALLLR